jgi:FKBP-type peptidyl-prolyl cis-trans isomerase
MKIAVFMLCAVLAIPAFAQSKKQLKAENQKLMVERDALKSDAQRLASEIEALKPKEVSLANASDKVSYSIGVMIGSNVEMQGVDSLNVDAMFVGMKDVLEKKTPKLSQEECQMIVQEYMETAMEKKTAKAKEEGASFLAENKTKAGVQTTASGLQYQVITEGTGKKPTPTSSVTVHYTGKLTDGTVFDSSVQRGQPATFPLNQVIKGWTEGLQLIKEGGKAILYIPYDLGYGDRGAGGQIPPYSTLIFEVELLKVN